MLRSGHYGAAMVLYAPVGLAVASRDPALAAVCGVGAVSLSGLPDCDRRLPLVAHRGVTHTLAFLFVVAAVLGWFGVILTAVLDGAPGGGAGGSEVHRALPGVLVGVVAVGSHLLADAVTPAGVPLLWPVTDRRYGVSLTTSSDPVANAILFAVGVGATAAVAGAVAGGP